jgi:hypothetical protein
MKKGDDTQDEKNKNNDGEKPKPNQLVETFTLLVMLNS